MITTRNGNRTLLGMIVAVLLTATGQAGAAETSSFAKQVAPILEQRCLSCHGDKTRKGGLSLATAATALAGGDKGAVIVPGKADESLLVKMISGTKPKMPRSGAPLTAGQIALIRQWIAQGAKWPDGLVLQDRKLDGDTWWSLQPLHRPPLPVVKNAAWVRTPIDAFILSRLEQEGLAPNPEADRRTLIRRVSYDLLGLPPTPAEIDAFVNDKAPDAYTQLVDRLLASPRYGERWGRHWLDVAHYGDTHGYDKDKLRPNAWPYRDYVIRAFNDDKPYTRFVQEQLAGDVLYPGTRDGIVALGFLAAGPWDFVGQVELREGTLDKQITRNLDRDDMVATTMNTFAGLTVQCARCHDHKFDPISQEDYYSLQAVFAAVDRANRPYEPNAAVAEKRAELAKRQAELAARRQRLDAKILQLAGPELAAIDKRLDALSRAAKGAERPEFGYHSQIAVTPDVVKWVQVDLGRPTAIEHIVYVGCHDTFNNIGAGFGFPVRYKIEIADDPEFKKDVLTVADQTRADVPNPGVKPQSVAVGGKRARYVRMTATKLALRAGDYIFALAELSVLTPQGGNAAAGAPVTALDSIEAPPRWRKANLVDGYYYGVGKEDHLPELAKLHEQRRAILNRVADAALQRDITEIERALKDTAAQLAALPPPGMVYAAATHFAAEGSFTPTKGKPRPIYLLRRGSEKHPVREVGPGTVACLSGLESHFPPSLSEGERRAALARWITDPRNPLTWRSIVNRVWHYHFGRGLVETPNDFGRMGATPSHPELLDWLAVEFRDSGQSLKQLHRLLVTSAAYRQTSADNAAFNRIDGSNRLLWRMNRRRLEAEAVRDTVLAVSGRLDLTMYGPGFKPFGFKDDHSPHYLYAEHNPDDPASHRRSVYRFLVRSVPEPFMETMDCADPSLRVEKRNETLTALQALALLNDKFMVRMAEHFAGRIEMMGPDLPARLTAGYRLALGRAPTAEEITLLTGYAQKHGLANACRLILNTNEFCFID
jgi:mono/diheme cytochrome c family protein